MSAANGMGNLPNIDVGGSCSLATTDYPPTNPFERTLQVMGVSVIRQAPMRLLQSFAASLALVLIGACASVDTTEPPQQTRDFRYVDDLAPDQIPQLAFAIDSTGPPVPSSREIKYDPAIEWQCGGVIPIFDDETTTSNSFTLRFRPDPADDWNQTRMKPPGEALNDSGLGPRSWQPDSWILE